MIVTNLDWSQNPAYDQLRFFVNFGSRIGHRISDNSSANSVFHSLKHLDRLDRCQLIDIDDLQPLDNWMSRCFE